jgi:aminoglycoside phosphotransferase (APT) family kinase protein
VLTPPRDFTDADLATALAEHWNVTAPVTYRPVGFGSHHWQVGTEWFATVDEDPDFAQLTASLLSATDVPVAVAPILTNTGNVLARQGNVAVALYPFMTGESFTFGDYRDDDHRRATLDLVIAVHRTPPRHALTDTFTPPTLPPIGDTGPYARPAADLITRHATTIADLQARHHDLAATIDHSRLVLTHGEPHPGNTMHTADGWRLIDWDTALVAPPERDLWHLATPETLTAYEKATGVTPREELLELYRLRWDLTDLAEVAAQFSRPHTGTEDDAEAWRILTDLLEKPGSPTHR